MHDSIAVHLIRGAVSCLRGLAVFARLGHAASIWPSSMSRPAIGEMAHRARRPPR